MLRKLSLVLAAICFVFTTVEAQVGQGALKGKVIDKETGEAVPFANVVVESGGIPAGGTTSDFEGNYTIKPLKPGIYTLKATYVGKSPISISGVEINSDRTTYWNIELTGEGIDLPEVEIIYFDKLIEVSDGQSDERFTADEIKTLPVRSIGELQGVSAGVVAGQIRGTRAGASQIFIDGIKVRGSTSLPRAAIGEVNVITGGVPALYGDLTGGVTTITTRGPSRDPFTSVELVSSRFKKNDRDEVWGLDNQGYNLVGLTYGGPLLFKRDKEGKKEKPLIGILVATEYISVVDPRPSAVQTYQAKEGVIERLKSDPLRETGTGSGSIPNSFFLRSDDFKLIDTRRNVGSQDINLSTNLDFNTTENTTLKFGGTFTRSDRHNEVNSNSPGQAYSLLNFENNARRLDYTWRVFGRFTQSFNNETDEEENGNASLIKNAFISFQVDFTKDHALVENDKHQDNFFDYGYIGNFKYTRETDQLTNYQLRFDTLGDGTGLTAYFYEGPNQAQIDFTPGDKNPVLANYTSDYYSLYVDSAGNLLYPDNYDRVENIRTGGGLLNGDVPRDVYSLWSDVGYQFNSYQISNTSQFRISAMGSADIGNHAITLGFEYEQRDDRSYSLSPGGLWTIGRNLMNRHIAQLDRDNYSIDYRFGGNYPVVTFQQLYDPLNQSTFDKNVRESFGLPVDGLDFIDMDSYDPSQFKLEYFSADELLNGGSPLVFYQGYNHVGEKLTGARPTIDDFFNARNEEGDLKREVPSYQPIYVAGYIQDRFDFDDLIFRVGLRVDRFDANQVVLKDAFSLFPTVKAGDDVTGSNHPANIGDDFVVYVSDPGNPSPDNITGYRDLNGNDQDIWYNADGQEIINPLDIKGPEGVTPWLVDSRDRDPQEDLTSASFEDYSPQVTVMPRVSFSFPISDEANFFANYDVLTQRPTSDLEVNPIDYLFLGTRNVVLNNPNLKPVKQITYEIGFEQVVTKNSAISYSAFYRESRDDIQVVRKIGAYPVDYRTFENIDFGTVKGLSVSYDMRRIRNIQLRSNYTLQFAEGTGSNSTSQLNLINSNNPNLRTIQPLGGLDRRHTINLILDFRYANGKDYNGPVIGGKDVFANSGFSVISTAASGLPYSKSSVITSGGLFTGGQGRRLEGGINGSRLPWTFNMDVRIDKNFNVKLSSASSSKNKRGILNVYVQILNALNANNVIGVYNGTGSADDDGYLSEPVSQNYIKNQNDPESFKDLYTAKILNDGFYAAQRRIRLGLQLSF